MNACDAAQLDFTEGLRVMAAGDPAAAARLFDSVVARCEGAPAAQQKARDAAFQARREGSTWVDVREPTGLARAELVLGQTLHGLTQGVWGCVMLPCTDGALGTGIVLLSAGLGGTASYFLTTWGISPGDATAVNSGTAWGIFVAAALAQMTDLRSNASFFRAMSLGGWLGTAAGVGVALLVHPAAGQVSLVNSFGIWTGALVGTLIAQIQPEAHLSWTLELVSTAVALGLGTVFAAYVPLSRTRVLLMDLGALLGGLLGAAISAATNPSLIGAGAAIGGAVGLGGMALVAREWDRPTGLAVTLLPVGPGSRAGFSCAVAF